MLPHNHFLIAGLIIAPVGSIVFPEKSIVEIGGWIVVGGLLSSAIDLDIYVLTVLKSRKEKQLIIFRNPLEIYKQFSLFMDTITGTGVLKAGLKTHLLSSVFIIVACYLFLGSYMMPVAIGVVSHLISDIPNLKRLAR